MLLITPRIPAMDADHRGAWTHHGVWALDFSTVEKRNFAYLIASGTLVGGDPVVILPRSMTAEN